MKNERERVEEKKWCFVDCTCWKGEEDVEEGVSTKKCLLEKGILREVEEDVKLRPFVSHLPRDGEGKKHADDVEKRATFT